MFMKYKRISTKDYLVNEDQFIDLLENKALEGWYLKNISLNFLTFEKRTPQRKHYKIYYILSFNYLIVGKYKYRIKPLF